MVVVKINFNIHWSARSIIYVHVLHGYWSTEPWATFSYCPFDVAECKIVWKRFATVDLPLWSLVLPAFSSIDSNPLLEAVLLWFSLFAMTAKRWRFGLGNWNISCHMENKLRCESFCPISIDWTCSSQTLPCRLCINYRGWQKILIQLGIVVSQVVFLWFKKKLFYLVGWQQLTFPFFSNTFINLLNLQENHPWNVMLAVACLTAIFLFCYFIYFIHDFSEGVCWGVHSQGVIVNMPITLYRERSKLLTCEEQWSIVLVWGIANYNENKPCLTCSVFKQDRMSLSVFSHKEVRVVISVFIDSCLDTWRKKKHTYSTDTGHHITVCVIWQGGYPLIQTELIWCGLME